MPLLAVLTNLHPSVVKQTSLRWQHLQDSSSCAAPLFHACKVHQTKRKWLQLRSSRFSSLSTGELRAADSRCRLLCEHLTQSLHKSCLHHLCSELGVKGQVVQQAECAGQKQGRGCGCNQSESTPHNACCCHSSLSLLHQGCLMQNLGTQFSTNVRPQHRQPRTASTTHGVYSSAAQQLQDSRTKF